MLDFTKPNFLENKTIKNTDSCTPGIPDKSCSCTNNIAVI